MRPVIVVVVEIGFDSVFCFLNRFIVFDVDFLVLQRSPEPFDKDVVNCSTFAVHAYMDSSSFQDLYVTQARKL